MSWHVYPSAIKAWCHDRSWSCGGDEVQGVLMSNGAYLKEDFSHTEALLKFDGGGMMETWLCERLQSNLFWGFGSALLCISQVVWCSRRRTNCSPLYSCVHWRISIRSWKLNPAPTQFVSRQVVIFANRDLLCVEILHLLNMKQFLLLLFLHLKHNYYSQMCWILYFAFKFQHSFHSDMPSIGMWVW